MKQKNKKERKVERLPHAQGRSPPSTSRPSPATPPVVFSTDARASSSRRGEHAAAAAPPRPPPALSPRRGDRLEAPCPLPLLCLSLVLSIARLCLCPKAAVERRRGYSRPTSSSAPK